LSEFEKLTHPELSANVQKALPIDAPLATKVMTARAMVPLMSGDLVAALYYLIFDSDKRIAKTAEMNIKDLPENILIPVLRDPRTSVKILNYFSIIDEKNASIIEAVALNTNTPDDVFVTMAKRCSHQHLIDIFAQNQARILRCPEIIFALSKNPLTPRSSLERAEKFYELQKGRHYTEDVEGAKPSAEEEGVDDDELEEDFLEDEDEDFDEEIESPDLEEMDLDDGDIDDSLLLDEEIPQKFTIHDLLKENYEVDEDFANEFLVDPEDELSQEKKESLENKIRRMTVMDKMRLGLHGNIEARNILIKNSNKLIQECVIRNPQITIEEVMRMTKNKTMREELIRMICMNRDWVRNYAVKLNLVWNPKTPMTIAMKWLPLLNIKDLEKLAKSKQIPGMVAVTAKKAVQAKQRRN